MSTDYILPAETCAMVNVALDAKNQALKLCAVEGVDIVSTYISLYTGTGDGNSEQNYVDNGNAKEIESKHFSQLERRFRTVYETQK